MARASKTKEETGNEVAIFQPARLPYHEAVEERFGVDKGQWKVLVEAIFPAAKTVDSIVMALSYCKSRGLDPFKRPVHIVPVYDSNRREMVESVWPGISELRTTASRTKGYAGCDEAQFGPIIEREFSGRVKDGGDWKDLKVQVSYPEWCRITVYRIINGERCKFVGPKVVWEETYATMGKSDIPNKMWQERPEGQIEKCAEAAALRRAFPEEIGNELTAEEMAGRNIHDHDIVTVSETKNVDAGPPRAAIAAPQPTETIEGELVVEEVRDAAPPRRNAPQPPAEPPAAKAEPVAPLEDDDAPQPHQIPGKGHTFESWAEAFIDLVQTSPDTAVAYRWMDANRDPLDRLKKGKPSVSSKVDNAVKRLMEELRETQAKAEIKAAGNPEGVADMDDGPSTPASEGFPHDPEEFLKLLDATLGKLTNPDDLEDAYARFELHVDDLMPPDRESAAGIYRKHESRLAP